MINKIVNVPEWMLKSLKDDSKLRKAEVFEIMGYKSLNSLNSSQMRGLIEKGEVPPMFKKAIVVLVKTQIFCFGILAMLKNG